MELDTIGTVYQAGGAIVPQFLNRNNNQYSKDGTEHHRDARVKGNIVKNKWLDCHETSAKEDITIGILSRKIYEHDISESACNSESNEYLDEGLSGCDNVCSSQNYVISYEKL